MQMRDLVFSSRERAGAPMANRGALSVSPIQADTCCLPDGRGTPRVVDDAMARAQQHVEMERRLSDISRAAQRCL